jgi:hypothetical protein
MLFHTKVDGIPCQCLVTAYYPSIPMRITGTGMGDADPPEDEYFTYSLYDRKGYPAPWLENKLTCDDNDRLLNEYKQLDY